MIENTTYNTENVCEMLGCKPHQIEYMFFSGKLKRVDYQLDSGVRRYTQKQVSEIKKLLSR